MSGAASGGLLTFFVQRWKYGIDRWTLISDELVKEIKELSDLSSEFWLSPRDGSKDMKLSEVRIKGGLARLDALKLPIEDWCVRSDVKKFTDAYSHLANSISGGKFTSNKRTADEERAFQVQQASADLIGTIREVLRNGVTWRAFAERSITKLLNRH